MRRAIIAIFALITLTACGSPTVSNVGPTQTRQAELDQLTAVALRPTPTNAPLVVVIATQAPTATATPDASIPAYWTLMADVLDKVHTITVDVATACDAPNETCTVAQAQGQSRMQTQTQRLSGVSVPTPCKVVDKAIGDYIVKSLTYVTDVGLSLIYKPTQSRFLQQQSGDLDKIHTATEALNAAMQTGTCKN